MGMYTALHLSVALKSDDMEVINVLKYMCGDEDYLPRDEDLEHPLFATNRWRSMLRCSSFYHNTVGMSSVVDKMGDHRHYVLNVMSDFKNYSGEVKEFMNYIAPHIDHYSGDFLGYTRYEEMDDPTLIYYRNGQIEYKEVGNE